MVSRLLLVALLSSSITAFITERSMRMRSLEAVSEFAGRAFTERLVGGVIVPPESARLFSSRTTWTHRNDQRILWFVDLETCDNCLADLESWSAFVRSAQFTPYLILSGVTVVEAKSRLRQHSLTNIAVYVDEDASFTPDNVHTIGWVKLLTDSAGLVLLARGKGSGCEWDFEDYVADLPSRLGNDSQVIPSAE